MSGAHVTRSVTVYVLVPPNVLLLDIAGPIEVLRKANQLQSRVHFGIRYIGPEAVCGSSVGLALTGLLPLPERLSDGAMVILPGHVEPAFGDVSHQGPSADADQQIISWLSRTIRPGIRLISICSGAILAGRAGLLDGYECTTHHGSIADLIRVAPKARVRENRLFVEDRERLTSAGITTGIDLMLHLVAQMAGYETALAVARYLVVYLRRSAEDPQLSPWLEGRNHVHPVIHRAQDAVTRDPAREWSVEALADLAGASPRNLSRLFNEHTGLSVTDYVNRMRIALARDLLSSTRLGMEALAERTGFSSSRQLRRAWSRYHDASPREFRERLQIGT